jgi:hypothetical protein
MTEAEWLASDRACSMVRGGRTFKASSRKLRLLATACCRQAWKSMTAADLNAVEMAELFADKKATEGELEAARSLVGGSGAERGVLCGNTQTLLPTERSRMLEARGPAREAAWVLPTVPSTSCLGAGSAR